MATTRVGSNYVDHIVFKKRNPIIMRSICLLFGIIVYGCMVVDAWAWSGMNEGYGAKSKKCLYGEDADGVCSFGIFVSFVALLGAIMFLGGEFVIDKVPKVHIRLQYYFIETVFSAIWTFMFLICFIMLETQWVRGGENELTEIEKAGAAGSVKAAIWFSFLSIPVWAACSFTSLQRYRVMRAELEYQAALHGRRPSAYPATITTIPGTEGQPNGEQGDGLVEVPIGSTTVTF